MKRPKQHIIETSSKKAFESLLPDKWVIRPLSPDYGIDYIVELFEDNKSTGKFFYVQLKGTNQRIHNNQVKISLRTSSLEYYQTLPLPILFVVYSTKVKKFWGIWINEYLRTKEIRKNQSTLQLTFDNSHIINKEFIESIDTKFCLEIHKKISIAHYSDHEIGELYHNILEKWLQHFYGDVLTFDGEHLPLKVCFSYSYKNRHLSIEVDYNLLGRYVVENINVHEQSDFLNYPIIDYSQIPNELREILFLMATIFANENVLTSLNLYKMLLCDYSGKFKNPEALFNIGKIASEKNRIAEFQELIEKSIECKEYDDFQLLNTVYLFYPPNSMTLIKDYYKENLLSVISSADDNISKAVFSYNLANSYRSSDNVRKAIKYYMQAKRLEPDYLNRDYWWYELAGVLFRVKHYKWAESCYLKAHDLSNIFEPLIFALIGDSLFFQGKFAEAIKWFDRYFERNDKPLSEFCLKYHAIKFFINNKLENPDRNPQFAISLTEKAIKQKNDKNAVSTLMKAISIDPLCGLAWFNYAVYMNKMKKYKDSSISFLVCCLIQDWDREAWINALFLSFSLKENLLFFHILDTIRFKFGKSISKDIIEFIKKQPHLTNEVKKDLFVKLRNILESPDGKDEIHE